MTIPPMSQIAAPSFYDELSARILANPDYHHDVGVLEAFCRSAGPTPAPATIKRLGECANRFSLATDSKYHEQANYILDLLQNESVIREYNGLPAVIEAIRRLLGSDPSLAFSGGKRTK